MCQEKVVNRTGRSNLSPLASAHTRSCPPFLVISCSSMRRCRHLVALVELLLTFRRLSVLKFEPPLPFFQTPVPRLKLTNCDLFDLPSCPPSLVQPFLSSHSSQRRGAAEEIAKRRRDQEPTVHSRFSTPPSSPGTIRFSTSWTRLLDLRVFDLSPSSVLAPEDERPRSPTKKPSWSVVKFLSHDGLPPSPSFSSSPCVFSLFGYDS